ncbi:MAG: cell division protein ZapA [Candidatus Krumholzibacteriota bacterium]|nr:cell division protein ZapA [Candidatus Krumholzibacteriota bacterium]
MTGKNTEKVEIFGQEYKIKGAGDPEYIHMVAGYVDKKMREIAHSSGIMSQSRIAILAALNIADELYQERKDREDAQNELGRKAAKLGELIESKIGVGP